MTALTKIKLQNDKRGCWETLQKGQKKKRETSGNKKMPRNWQKRSGKSLAAQGENTEISTRKGLKICKCHQLNTAKCYENTNSEYTIEYINT